MNRHGRTPRRQWQERAARPQPGQACPEPGNPLPSQDALFDGSPPAGQRDADAAKHALDQLFSLARKYRSSEAYLDLVRFIARFRFYAPFNAMLVHVQMPGATYVAPATRWLRDYRHHLRANAKPLVILQPMGPVMFVFDVSDTEPEAGAPALPRDVTHPFEVRAGRVGGQLARTIDNARRDGVDVATHDAGSQSAGEIRIARPGRTIRFRTGEGPTPQFELVPLWYELVLNADHSPETKYATLVHELGHLYCGHLGTPNQRWWPDRRGLAPDATEFEAESVCYLVCRRVGIDTPSDEYLSDYVKAVPEVPPISLECVMKAAGLIEQMGRERLSPRKPQR